jgi:hypothetical protein
MNRWAGSIAVVALGVSVVALCGCLATQAPPRPPRHIVGTGCGGPAAIVIPIENRNSFGIELEIFQTRDKIVLQPREAVSYSVGENWDLGLSIKSPYGHTLVLVKTKKGQAWVFEYERGGRLIDWVRQTAAD